MKERKIESHFVDGIDRLGGRALKLAGFIGWPDRTVLLPGGRVVFVELKRPKREGGKKGPLQDRWRLTLTGLGFRHEFLWSIEQVDAFLETL